MVFTHRKNEENEEIKFAKKMYSGDYFGENTQINREII